MVWCDTLKSNLVTFFKLSAITTTSMKRSRLSTSYNKRRKLKPSSPTPSRCSQNDGDSKIIQLQNNPANLSLQIEMAVESLRHGSIIALPTDTVYGIAGLAQSSAAIARIYSIKGRDLVKPISISVGDLEDVYKWGKVTISESLLKDLLPGPVTVVFERTALLNPTLNPGTSLVGIRVPDYGFVREVSRMCKEPLALTSANVSSQESTLSVKEFEELWPELDLVFDGGVLDTSSLSKKGSTVVDLSKKGLFTIIRDGSALESTVLILKRHGLNEDRKL